MMENLKINLNENRLCFSANGFEPVFSQNGDFWRIFLDNDEIKELSVFSSAQKAARTDIKDDTVRIFYDYLIAENNETYEISMIVYIQSQDGVLNFWADIDNKSGARVNEIQMPFVDVERLSVDKDKEILFIPDGLGAKIENPRAYIEKNFHTEYMSADYNGIWCSATYPNCMSLPSFSMPWFGVQSGEYFFCLLSLQKHFRVLGFGAGTAPRGRKSRLMLYAGQYPAVEQGEHLVLEKSQMAVFKGDWRNAADYYKTWAENTWMKKNPVPSWVNNMTGWQRIILKHQYGEIFFKYDDLPRLYKEGAKYGIHTLLVFGWWKGRFDNNYPEFEADPLLGGEKGLKEAVREVQRLGGRVLLYSNGNLIDVKTDFYKNKGWKICAKDIDGNEYREHYRFSGNGSLLKLFGYKSFVTACHCTDQWKEQLLAVGRLKLDLGADSVFYDQLSCCVKACFDKTHLHKNRIDEEPEYRLKNINAVRELLSPMQAIGSEWVSDRMFCALDYIHGCGGAMNYGEDSAYPDLFLHTFGRYVISNRFIHDEKEGFEKHLNYAFVYNLIFDVSVYRGRVIGIAGLTNYAEYVKKMIELKEQYCNYFYNGKFVSACDLKLPQNVRSANYTHGDRMITVLWNDTDEKIVCNVYGQNVSLDAGELNIVEGKNVFL